MFNSGSRVNFMAACDAIHAALCVIVVVHLGLRIDGRMLRAFNNTIQLDMSLLQFLQYPMDIALLLSHSFQGASIILLRNTWGQPPFLYPLWEHLKDSSRRQIQTALIGAVLATRSRLLRAERSIAMAW